MPRVLVGGKLHPSGLDLLRASSGMVIEYVEDVTTESLKPMIHEADALLLRTQPLPGELIAASPKLKIVSRHGVGYDAVDMDALKERRIPLAIVGDVNSRAVAEHAMMLMLAAGKRLLRYDAALRGENWNYRNSLEAEELYGKTLLIIGFGRIGQTLAHLARAFGMKIVAYDPYLNADQIRVEQVCLEADLKTALGSADYVSLHVPKTKETILGAKELKSMKSSAIVINTARGGVVDEAALADALTSGQIAAAGLDVYDREPPQAGDPLTGLDQAILTPHSASLTLQCAERMAISSAQNIVDFFNGKLDLELVVNREEIGL